MRKVIHKVFMVWDFDKEEAWLNEMAAIGLSLVSVGWCRYEFEDSAPGEYKIRLDFLKDYFKSAENEKYIAFLEETGAEQVGAWGGWVYFRKKAAEGDFQLFSDNASRISYLTRIIRFIGALVGINVFAAVYNLSLFFTLHHNEANLLGLVNLLIAAVCAPGLFRIVRKRKKLREEQQIFE